MLEFHIYDVFTDRPFAGNPLAIVLGADDLDTVQMQMIARQFNLSETIFVMKPLDPAHTAKVRIFFPTAEIPFAGHPTIGCAIHLAGGQDGQIVLEEEAGLVPVEIHNGQAEFTAPRLPVPHGGPVDKGLLAQALSLPRAAIGFDSHQPHGWQGGPAFLFIPIAGLYDLGRAKPTEPFWSQAMESADVDSAYLYAAEGEGYRARMFSPTAGIPEDPATGSASALLAEQLLRSAALHEGENRIRLKQGVEVGRPSEIGLRAYVNQNRLQQIRISGTAVPIAEGHIRAP